MDNNPLLPSSAVNLPKPEVLTNGNPTRGADQASVGSTQNTAHNPTTPAPNPTGSVPSEPNPR